MDPATPAWTDALTSARRGIADGQRDFRAAARRIAQGLRDLRSGRDDGDRLVEDFIELSDAARQIKANVAVIRADREIGEEILNMVRHDEAARQAQDTRPDPRYTPARRNLEILV